MTFSTCTVATPTPMPARRWGHGAGKASIAATSTSVASTPLQPASMATANGLAFEPMTLPDVVIDASNVRISAHDTRATVYVHGVTTKACAHGVSSSPNASASSSTKTVRNRGMAGILSGNRAHSITLRLFALRRGPSRSRSRERWAVGEIAPDAVGNRFREALLVPRAPQLLLFLRIGDEGRLDENRRNVRRLQHCEARLLHRRL